MTTFDPPPRRSVHTRPVESEMHNSAGRHAGGSATQRSSGQPRRYRPRSTTVRFTLHCRHHAASPRTAGPGHERTHAPQQTARLAGEVVRNVRLNCLRRKKHRGIVPDAWIAYFVKAAIWPLNQPRSPFHPGLFGERFTRRCMIVCPCRIWASASAILLDRR
jgi:hypothetical protein